MTSARVREMHARGTQSGRWAYVSENQEQERC
jgi:hypothetical protein